MTNKAAFALFAVFLALPAETAAQSVSFQVESSTRSATLAQPVIITMDIMHPTGFEVKLDSAALAEDGAFDIASVQNTANSQLADGLVKESVAVTVVPYTLGETTLPALRWTALDGMGNTGNFTSPAIPFKVAPAIAKDLNKGKIFDIVGPLKPFNWLWLLLAAALIAALWWYIRKRKRKQAGPLAAPKKDTRPLEVRINEEIDQLVASGLWESGKVKEFYIDLSDIAREYIDSRYKIDTSKLTTYELLKLLGKKDLDKLVVTAVRKFMSSCDLAKFAKVVPDTHGRDKDIATLRAIIEDTTPRKTAAPGDEEVLALPEGDFDNVAASLKKPAAGKGGAK